MTEMSSKWPNFPLEKIMRQSWTRNRNWLGISLGTGTLIFAPSFYIKVILSPEIDIEILRCSVQDPKVQFSNLADFYVYLTLISLNKINLYHRFKLTPRSARFSDDLQI